MSGARIVVFILGCFVVSAPLACQQAAPDAVAILVGRLDLERYKTTLRGLTKFGDRRQGTDRNRAAIDWIEAQLRSYGCSTERLKYEYSGPTPRPPRPDSGARAARQIPEWRSAGVGRSRGRHIYPGV